MPLNLKMASKVQFEEYMKRSDIITAERLYMYSKRLCYLFLLYFNVNRVQSLTIKCYICIVVYVYIYLVQHTVVFGEALSAANQLETIPK